MTARTVVITGATRGVGRGIADAFARRGDALVIVGRSTDANPNRLGLPGTLEGVAGELRAAGSDVVTINADLARTEVVDRVTREIQDACGTPDVLVNNAAATFIGPFLDIPVSRWKTALNLNLLAPVALIQGFLPGMLERDEGRIINITSTAARTRDVSATSVPQLAYAASKAALDSFSFGLVQDLADTGVALEPARSRRAHRIGRVPPHRPQVRRGQAPHGAHGPVRRGGGSGRRPATRLPRSVPREPRPRSPRVPEHLTVQ